MTNINQYNSRVSPTWCPECGNFGIFTALKQAFLKLNLKSDQVCLFYDIGCFANSANFFNVYGFNGLHGRSLGSAIGASLAHHQFPIISLSGDGGAYGEGLNHFIQASRANYKLTYLVSDNQLYSLTTGQTSPTTPLNQQTKSSPYGNIIEPFNPLATALINNCSFVARGYSGQVDHLTNLIIKALKHPGFSLIDILSPCVTWNSKVQPWSWYQEKVYQLKDENHSFEQALKLSKSLDKLPIGIFYQEKRKTYQEKLPQLKNQPLVKQLIEKIKIDKLVKEFI